MKKPEKDKQDQAPETELNAEERIPVKQDEAQEPEKQPEPAQEPDKPPKAEEADTKPVEEAPPAESDKPDTTVQEPAGENPAPKPVEASGDEQLQKELLAARSQLAAYAAGVAPEMIQDAVILATAEAQTAGEVTEEAVTKAMAGVLKRHPEWKAAGGQKSGGFRLGADPDATGKAKASKENSTNKKRWNRFN